MALVAHPPGESMARLGRISPYFQVPITDPAEGSWIGADELSPADDPQLRPLVIAMLQCRLSRREISKA